MARLCILGSVLGPLFDAIRLKMQAALRSLPRLFMPALIYRARVRSFAESQKGSRLAVRSPLPAPARSALRPSSRFTSLLEERKASPQARSRPWASKLKSLWTSRSSLSSTSPGKPPSKPEIHAAHTKEIARVDKVRAKPAILVKGPSKNKSVKMCVRFGKTSVVSVPRWIERQKDVFDGPPVVLCHLKGWSVTSLLEPDEDGEEKKYITYWDSGSFSMMTSNHAEGPPDRCGCPWSALAWYQTRHPTWRPKMVFEAWRRERERILESGWRQSRCDTGGSISTARRGHSEDGSLYTGLITHTRTLDLSHSPSPKRQQPRRHRHTAINVRYTVCWIDWRATGVRLVFLNVYVELKL
ncbi:hypothetical protein BJX65DRAFT_309625 [Aspergillus insuetus]